MNAEPGVDEAWLGELEARGRHGPALAGLHHYFGGVSAVGRRGSARIRAGAARSALA